MEAFKNIYQICFEPFFFIAITGVFFCIWQKGKGFRFPVLGIILAAGFIFMLIWRMLYQIDSSRYAVGLVPLSILFLVYFIVNRRWLTLLPPKWRSLFWRLAQIAIITLSIVCVCKMLRTNKRQQVISSMIKELQNKSAGYRYPLLMDFSKIGSRISYYCKIERLSTKNNLNEEGQLRSIILKGIIKADILFFIFPKGSDEKLWQKRIKRLYPYIFFTKIYTPSGKGSSIYYWVNNAPEVGEQIDISAVSAMKSASRGDIVEDFERLVKLDISKIYQLRELKKRGAPFVSGKYFEFPENWLPNPAHGFANPVDSVLQISRDGDSATIAGQGSLKTKSRGNGGIYFVKSFPAAEKYSGEILFRAVYGAKFALYAYCYDGHGKFIESKLFQQVYCIFPGMVRRVRWKIAEFSSGTKTFKLALEFGNGEISFDNLIFRRLE